MKIIFRGLTYSSRRGGWLFGRKFCSQPRIGLLWIGVQCVTEKAGSRINFVDHCLELVDTDAFLLPSNFFMFNFFKGFSLNDVENAFLDVLE